MGTDLPRPWQAHPRATVPSRQRAERVQRPHYEATGSFFQKGSSNYDNDSIGPDNRYQCLDLPPAAIEDREPGAPEVDLQLPLALQLPY